MERLIMIGMGVIFIGILIVIIGSILSATGEGKVKVGFGGFIGPIPFGWATDKRMMWFVIGLSCALLVFWILFNWLRVR